MITMKTHWNWLKPMFLKIYLKLKSKYHLKLRHSVNLSVKNRQKIVYILVRGKILQKV